MLPLLGGLAPPHWMTDPRIARTVDAMVEASLKLQSSEHCSNRLALGAQIVEVSYPTHQSPAEITIHDAFLEPEGDGKANFQLTVIDDSIVGRPPTLDWPRAWYEPFGVVKESLSQPYRFAVDVHSGSLSMFDPETRRAVVWFHDTSTVPYWFAATPFRLQLSWFADTFGGEMIHAAGLEFGDAAALVVGPSGAGKSTLTLSTMLQGNRTLGDDFLLLSGHSVQTIYRRAKVHDATCRLLGDRLVEIGSVVNAEVAGEKRIVNTYSLKISQDLLPVAAVFVPRIGTHARVSPLSKPNALRSTLGPTMMGLLGGSAGTLRRITSLVNSVPTFRIDVGPDLAANAHALIEAMADVTRDHKVLRGEQQGRAS